MHLRTTLAGINVEIVGVPDFLLPSGTSYLVRDSKVARRINNGSYRASDRRTPTQ